VVAAPPGGGAPSGAKMEGSGCGRVMVYARVRPAAAQERGISPAVDLNDAARTVRVRNDADAVERMLGGQAAESALAEAKEFTFDAVFPECSSQRDVFSQLGLPILKESMRGLNATILAYGQTGSGKTHSLLNQGEKTEDAGLLPRLIASLFLQIAQDGVNVYFVEAAALQVYNEQVDDLLHPEHQGGKGANIAVQNGGSVPGLTWIECKRPEAMIEAFARARQNLIYAETKMNKASSRSHAVFQIRLTKRERAVSVTASTAGAQKMECVRSRLCIVDLAGSERVKKSGAEGQQFKEATNINKSLLSLGNVVSALAAKKAHVPLRDSKLTRILDGCIGGNCKTSLLVCASPAAENAAETINTFEFASRAMRVEVDAKVNASIVEVSAKTLLADLTSDADALGGMPLGRELQELRRKSSEAAQLAQKEAQRREKAITEAQAQARKLQELAETSEQRCQKWQQEADILRLSESVVKGEACKLRQSLEKAEADAKANAAEASELRAVVAKAAKDAQEWRLAAEQSIVQVHEAKAEKAQAEMAVHKAEISRCAEAASAAVKEADSRAQRLEAAVAEAEARARQAEARAGARAAEDSAAIAELRGRLATVETERDELVRRLTTIEDQLVSERRKASEALRAAAAEAVEVRARAEEANQRLALLEAESTASASAAAQALCQRDAAVSDALAALESFKTEAEAQQADLRAAMTEELEAVTSARDAAVSALRCQLQEAQESASRALSEERDEHLAKVAHLEKDLAQQRSAWARERQEIQAAGHEALDLQRRELQALLAQGREEFELRMREQVAAAEEKHVEMQQRLAERDAAFAESEAQWEQNKEAEVEQLRSAGNCQKRRLAAAFKAARCIAAVKEAALREEHDDLAKRFAARESRQDDVQELERQRRQLNQQQRALKHREGDVRALALELQNRDETDRIFSAPEMRRNRRLECGVIPAFPGRKTGDTRNFHERKRGSSLPRPSSAGSAHSNLLMHSLHAVSVHS